MFRDRRHGDGELAQSIETIRKDLARAKERVRAHYPGARIRLALTTGHWIVVDPTTGMTIEASDSLEHLATGERNGSIHPQSGMHRSTERDDSDE